MPALDGYGARTGTFIMDVNATTTPAPTPVPGPPTPSPTISILTMEQGCLGATPLSLGATAFASTSGTPRYQTTACQSAYQIASPGIWYKVTGDGSIVEASLCGNTNFDTMVCVLLGWSGLEMGSWSSWINSPFCFFPILDVCLERAMLFSYLVSFLEEH
jgi:hypothetical protein